VFGVLPDAIKYPWIVMNIYILRSQVVKESFMKKLFMLVIVMLLVATGYSYNNEPTIAPPVPGSDPVVGDVWDLKYHWSDELNPNGVWSYGGGGTVGYPVGTGGHGDFILLATYSFDQIFTGQNGWGWVPCVSRAMNPGIVNATLGLPAGAHYDIEPNDIYGHGPYMARWTAPKDMRIMVTGNAWRMRNQAETFLYLLENGDWNNNTEAQRHYINPLYVTTFPRSAPLDFGPIIFNVTSGQMVTLFLTGNDFSAVNMTIESVSTADVTLTVNTNPSDVNTTVPATGMHTYPVGSVINLQANTYVNCANNGEVKVFDSWTGDVANPASASTTITLNSNQIVTANYIDGRQCGDTCHPYPQYDFTRDCIVNLADFAQFATGWMECTKPACD